MKVLGKDLIEGVKKAKGIVDESSVIEHLRGFKFNPRPDGKLDIAGSDGRLTLLAQIPYVETDNSDGTQLTLDSDKLQELIKYVNGDSIIELKYTEDEENVVISLDNYVYNTHKKEFENEFIDFDIINETEFDDVVDRKELIHVLESLVPLAKVDSPDGLHQTIYLDGNFAYLFDGSIAAKIEFATKKQYVIEQKSAKQILVLLRSSEADKVNLKLLNDGHEVLLRTEKDILVFKVMDPEIYDVDFMDDFKETFSFKINRLDFYQAIHRTKLATEEEEIFVKIVKDSEHSTTGSIHLKGLSDSGEQATDKIAIEDIEGEIEDIEDSEIDLLAKNYLKLSDAMRTKDVIIAIDVENLYLLIKDTQGKALALMTVNID